ncbi:Hypothetical protein HVR_LOCUS729 [uncultured virus]|nr:Hypothetical protein HVR_LOCUS729 [uncultured virus]
MADGETSSSRWIWIVIGVVVFILIITAVVIGIIFFLKPETSTSIPGCYNGDGITTGQTAAFRMTNHCCEPIWVEARAGPCSSPLPGQNQTVFQVDPGSFIDFEIPSTGLAATRFWAKWGCDENGTNCLMGDQDPTWPLSNTCTGPYGCGFDVCPTGGSCPSNGCTPPIDTLFEATWGCSGPTGLCNYDSSSCTGDCSYRGCPNGGCNVLDSTTSFDISQVDGWTLPYKLYVKGDPSDLAQCNNGTGAANINGSGLALNRCPTTEDLTNNGQQITVIDPNGPTGFEAGFEESALNRAQPDFVAGPITYSTESVNLQLINQNRIVGCFSPCQKLTDDYPFGFGQGGSLEDIPPTDMYCCPTPPISSTQCQQGPVSQTQYVQNVHSMAPGVYAYPYDDGIGLQSCPAVKIIYELELCGANAPAYPYPSQN